MRFFCRFSRIFAMPGMSARSSGSSLSLFKLNRIWDVIVLAVAFFFVFLAFSVVQNMASTVLPSTVAFPMLGCLYLAFALINLFGAAPLVDRIGTRPAMFFATITYTIFDASNVVAMLLADHLSAQFAVLIPSSVLIGAGAAILWTAQGSYVVKCASKYTIGRYTGVFFGIMSASNSVGPLFTSFLLENKFDKENAFKILSGVGALGPLLILLYIWWLRPEPSNSTFHSESSATEGQLATVDSTPLFLKVFKLVTCKKMWMVAPLFYLNSVEQTFSTGSLPLFVNTGDAGADLRTKLYLSAAYGASLTLASFVIGPITDIIANPNLILCIDCVAHMSVLIALWSHPSPLNNLTLLYPCAIIMAMSDATLLNQAYKLVAGLFPANPTAYAAYKFHSSLMIGIAFFLSKAMLTNGVPNMTIWVPVLGILFLMAIIGTWLVSHEIDWKQNDTQQLDLQTDNGTGVSSDTQLLKTETLSDGVTGDRLKNGLDNMAEISLLVAVSPDLHHEGSINQEVAYIDAGKSY